MKENIAGNWRESASYWEKHRQIIRQMFAPVTEALIQDARVAPGFNVLDVGTGPGEPALTVAQFVGNTGNVFGVDPTPEMIAAAQRASERGKIGNVRFEVASTDSLHFPAGKFDAVVSRFAAMFFPSPVEAIREILRVLKPKGYAALAVWYFADANPFHYVLSRVVERYAEPEPSAEGAADAFRYAASGKLRAIMDQAGAIETSERLFKFRIEAPLSVEEFWDLRSEMSDRLRSRLAKLPSQIREEVRRQVIDGLREYSTAGGMSFPAEVLIVSGRRASS